MPRTSKTKPEQRLSPPVQRVPGVQGDNEDPFTFMERLKAEMKKVRALIVAVRGGRFRGRKPNGDWWVTISPKEDVDGQGFLRGRRARDIRVSNPVELIQQVAVARCYSCGCDTDMHGVREPTEEEAKRLPDMKRCDGERIPRGESSTVSCVCTKTPEEIRKKQSDPAWIAERYALVLARKKATEDEARKVTASNVFEGLRGPPPPDESQAPAA